MGEGKERKAKRSSLVDKRDTNRRSAVRLQRESELVGGQLFAYRTREALVIDAKFLRDDLSYFTELLGEIFSSTKYTQVDLCKKAFEFTPQLHRIAKTLEFEHPSRERSEAPPEQQEQPENVDGQDVDENNTHPVRNVNGANENYDENPAQDTNPGRKRTFEQFTEDTAATRRAVFYAAAHQIEALNEAIHIKIANQVASDARHHSLQKSRIELLR